MILSYVLEDFRIQSNGRKIEVQNVKFLKIADDQKMLAHGVAAVTLTDEDGNLYAINHVDWLSYTYASHTARRVVVESPLRWEHRT